MRRTITASTVVVLALGLAACGGGTADLTQDKAKSALVEASDLPDGGWTAGEVDTSKPSKESGSADDLLKNAKDVSQDCKDAMKALGEVTPSDAKAYAKREYTKGTGDTQEQVQVVVATYDKAKDAPTRLTKVADTCKSLKLSEGGAQIELKMESPDLKADGAKGLQMSMDVMGQKVAMLMAAAPVGNNLVSVSTQGKDTDAVKKLVDETMTKQVDKVKKTAG